LQLDGPGSVLAWSVLRGELAAQHALAVKHFVGHVLRGADVAAAPALCALFGELGATVPPPVLHAALAGVWSPEAQHALRLALPAATAA
jgi:hypothetical protein